MILVIGARGQIARALARCDPSLTFAGRPQGDLADAQTVRRLCETLRPRIVLNAGAYTAVDAAETDRDSAFAVNATGAGALAAAAAAIDAPIVHLSTDYVFDGGKGAPYVENDAPNPINVYGASKLAGEKAVREANPQSVVLADGVGVFPIGKSFVSGMLQRATKDAQLDVVEDQHGSPSSADEIAANLLALAAAIKNRRAQPWGLYHLAGDGSASRCEWARAIFTSARALGGPSAEIIPVSAGKYPLPARRPANSALDCAKATNVLGLHMRPWREGVDHCVRLMAANDWSFE